MAPRASATNVTIQVQLLSATGSLYPVASSPSGDRLTSVCPTCYGKDKSLVKTAQQFDCPHEHGPFAQGDLLKASGSGKNMKYLGTAEEVKTLREEAAQDGPGRDINLSAYPADLVEDATFPIGTPWVFAGEGPAVDLLRSSIDRNGRIGTEKGDVILLGEIQIRTDAPPKLVSLRVRDDQLLVQEVARPENMNEFESKDAKVEDKLKSQFSAIMAASIEDFDATDHRSTVTEKFASFVQQRLGEGPVLALEEVKDDATLSLEDSLSAMLAKANA